MNQTQFSRGKAATALLKMMGEGQNQPLIAQKSTKFKEVAEKGEEDVISALPDCLLLEILSRLPSTNYAIRTSTLSKRWVHLWTLLPTLFFSYSDLPVLQSLENPSSYALLVDKTLTQCRQSKLKRFHVFVDYDIQYESQYKNWIRFAISRNVEELWLDIQYRRRGADYRLDESLLINSRLSDLRLVGCMLNSSGAITLKSLKSLCISNQNLDEERIVNILSGSPLLETLHFEYCCHYESESESDSEFDSESESEAEADIININAPNTLLLTQCPQLNLKKFKVYTWFHIRFESQLNSWIRYAVRCNVQEFILKFWSTDFKYEFNLDQIVFTASCFTKMELKGCILNPVGVISWKYLRSLRISRQSLNEDLISNILSGSPVLEYLELDDCGGYKRLDITSKSVKNLVISGYCNHNEKTEIDTIEVNAPNILSLTIQGNISLWKFLLVNVKCLVKAKLNYWCAKRDRHKTLKNTKEEILKGYIMSLAHVKELQVGCDCSMAVLNLQAQGFAFPSNVKFHNSISFLKEYLGWWK